MTASVNRFRERASPIAVLTNQNVSNTTVRSTPIVEPWRKGRTLTFLITSGTLASNDSLTFAVERRRRGTSTWDPVYEPNNSTALKATVQVGSGGSGKAARLASGLPLFLELDLNRLKVDKDLGGQSYDYDAIALTAVNGVAQNVNIGASAILTDLGEEPGDGDSVEDLLDRQRYTGGVS